ncbi:MAG: VWA domain-containing protein [Candidatus Eremiobacteraeota bacterium]|nr:VWA domain-containing protein [Candidatus Eremiobacteraeota bacterium]
MFKRSIFLILFLALAFYLAKWVRPLEILVGVGTTLAVMFFLYKRFEDSGDDEEDYVDDDELKDEGWGAPILQVGGLAVIMCLVFSGIFTWVLPPEPANAQEDPQVIRQREMTFQKIDTYTDAGSFDKAVDILNGFINSGIRNGELSGEQKSKLFARKVKILIAWSDNEEDTNKRMKLLAQAGELDRRYNTGNGDLIDEKVRNIKLENRDEAVKLPGNYQLKVHSSKVAGFSPVTIEMTVSVLDNKGNTVKNLREKDFKALVDGDKCGLELSRIQPSRNIVILQDISGSMKQEHLHKAWMGIKAVVNNLKETDKFCLVAFNDKPHLVCNWTGKVESVENAFKKLKPGGNTAIYDSVHFALKEVERWGSGKNYIIILTDGTDSSSKRSLEQIVKKVRAAKVPVLVIALKTSEFNANPLKKLSGISGGQYFETRNVTELKALFENAARFMDNRYTLYLKPDTIKATSEHTISLTVGRNLNVKETIKL